MTEIHLVRHKFVIRRRSKLFVSDDDSTPTSSSDSVASDPFCNTQTSRAAGGALGSTDATPVSSDPFEKNFPVITSTPAGAPISDACSLTDLTYRTEYERQLKTEVNDWSQLVKRKIQEINAQKTDDQKLGVSLLSEEQRRYLSAGLNLENYVKTVNEFSTLVERYIQRKSFLARRYEAILDEARAQIDNKALDFVETELLSKKMH